MVRSCLEVFTLHFTLFRLLDGRCCQDVQYAPEAAGYKLGVDSPPLQEECARLHRRITGGTATTETLFFGTIAIKEPQVKVEVEVEVDDGVKMKFSPLARAGVSAALVDVVAIQETELKILSFKDLYNDKAAEDYQESEEQVIMAVTPMHRSRLNSQNNFDAYGYPSVTRLYMVYISVICKRSKRL